MTQKQKFFHFALVLSGVDELTPDLEDALFGAGCDDATLYFSEGTAYLVFDRAAQNLKSAIISAIHDVESTKLGAIVTSVSPEHLVTITDIAHRTQLSKQAISLLVKGKRGAGNFPRPLLKIDNKSALWRWLDVVAWLMQYKKLADHCLFEEAKIIEEFNTVLMLRDPQAIAACTKLLKQLPSKDHH